jgi:hypothetical protein
MAIQLFFAKLASEILSLLLMLGLFLGVSLISLRDPAYSSLHSLLILALAEQKVIIQMQRLSHTELSLAV